MRTSEHSTAACICIALAACSLLSPIPVGGEEKPAEQRIYDESASADEQVSAAISIAKNERKHILLHFGANWCGLCLKLHKLMESDSSIQEELKRSYLLVSVDTNDGHNKRFSEKLGASNHGIPFLAVLNSDGKTVTTKDSSELEEEKRYSAEKLLSFLKAWEPGAIIGYSAEFNAKVRVVPVGCEDQGVPPNERRLYSFRAENLSDSEIICRLHAEHKTEPQTKILSLPGKGSTSFDFLMPVIDTPQITAEVLGPISRFMVPLPKK